MSGMSLYSNTELEAEPQYCHTIQMPEPPPLLPPKRPQNKLNKPSSWYLSEKERENYNKICVPLNHAALRGDWYAAEVILTGCPKVINMSITKREETVLHVVASTKHTYFAQKLVDRMKNEDLELQNEDGETALCLAVASTVKMVEVLLKKNHGLLKIRNKDNLPPFLCAVLYGDKQMVSYMYSKTNLADEKWNSFDQQRILISCLAYGLYDIAFQIFNHCKKTKFMIDTEVLRYLATNPCALEGTTQTFLRSLVDTSKLFIVRPPADGKSNLAELVRIIWGEVVKLKHEEISKLIAGAPKIEKTEENDYPYPRSVERITYPDRLLFTAARLGNYKFIIELLRLCPDIAWDKDDSEHTIFHVAVIHRQHNVYNLVYEVGSKKLGAVDRDGNNILHLAAIKPKQNRLNTVSGAALQMQRELLWFKEVQTIVSSVDRTKKNKQGKTPQELFTDEHTDLMKKGECWLKETASQSMVVAALIATITFAAAFTLPGGNKSNDGLSGGSNKSDEGLPVFLNRSAFIVFVITDAISLFTSSTSIIMFLAILTARYQENDFLVLLPLKLMVGLLTLFISIATMMIAFSASFFLLYSESEKSIPILVTALAGAPVILCAVLKHRLIYDVIKSIINSGHLFRPKKRML